MKTITKVFAAALTAFLLLAPNPVLGQSSFYFWWQVVDELDRPYANSAVKCSVYDLVASHVGASRDKVLHTTSELTTGSTMPLTVGAGGRFHFYSTVSTDVRVNCFSDYGGQGQSRLSRNTHKIVIPRGYGAKVVRFPFSATATINSASTRTGIWLPMGAVIRDVIVYNGSKPQTWSSNTVIGTSHLSVGFVSDHSATFSAIHDHKASALVHALSLNTDKDFIRPHVQVSVYSGTMGGGRVIVASHRGAALADFHTASGLVAAAGNKAQTGWYYEKAYVVDSPNGIELTYAAYSPYGGGTSGHVYVLFDLFHVGVFGSGIAP